MTTPTDLAALPLLHLPRHRKADPTVIRYWQALIESWRGPTIGRKRRRRRARGRARERARAFAVFCDPMLGQPW